MKRGMAWIFWGVVVFLVLRWLGVFVYDVWVNAVVIAAMVTVLVALTHLTSRIQASPVEWTTLEKRRARSNAQDPRFRALLRQFEQMADGDRLRTTLRETAEDRLLDKHDVTLDSPQARELLPAPVLDYLLGTAPLKPRHTAAQLDVIVTAIEGL